MKVRIQVYSGLLSRPRVWGHTVGATSLERFWGNIPVKVIEPEDVPGTVLSTHGYMERDYAPREGDIVTLHTPQKGTSIQYLDGEWFEYPGMFGFQVEVYRVHLKSGEFHLLSEYLVPDGIEDFYNMRDRSKVVPRVLSTMGDRKPFEWF